MKKDKKHRRVSAEATRHSAAASGAKGAPPLTVPANVRLWVPDKAGNVDLDFIPYEITEAHHPDDKNGSHEPGTLWWRREFYTHRDVGPNGTTELCPASVGKPCPMCEYRKKLTQDWEKNKDEIKSIQNQKWFAYSISDPDDADKGAIYAVKAWNFARNTKANVGLDVEIEGLPDEQLRFYDVEGGYTVKVRFGETDFEGSKYIVASKFTFEKRDDLDEEETLKRAADLNAIFGNLKTYDALKALFLQVAADDENPRASASGAGGGGSTTRKSGSRKPAAIEPEDADEDEDEDSDDDEAETAAPAKTGKAAPAKFKVDDYAKGEDNDGDDCEGKIIDIDGDTITIEDANGKEHDCDVSDLEPAKAPKSAKTGKAAAKANASVDEDPDDDDDDDDDDSEEETESEIKVGATVTDGETTGEVVKVKGDEVTVKDVDNGQKVVLDLDECSVVEEEPEADDSVDEDDDKIAVGDTVETEDDETGEVVKLHSSGEKAKVKIGDEEPKWVPMDELTKAAPPKKGGKKK